MKIGIDIGGSHIAFGLINDDYDIIEKKEIDIEKENKEIIQEFLINNIYKIIDEMLKEGKKIELIGIAAPGIIDNGIIKKAENLNLNNFKIIDELKKYINIPIFLQNDGKCAAIAEKIYGNARVYKDVLFLNIGTGIGGAVFEDNKLLGSSKIGSYELGHIVLQKNGLKCSCGNNRMF